MTNAFSAIFALACAATVSAAATAQTRAPSHKGTWTGTYRYSTGGGDITMRLDSAAQGWTAEVRATSEQVPNPAFTKATDVTIRGDSLEFTVSWGTPVIWTGRFTAQGGTGTILAQYWSGTWTVKRDAAKPKGD